MRCVLGFDGGGTKTDCILMDEGGRVLASGRSGPSNPFRIGVESAVRALEAAAREAIRASGLAGVQVAAVVAGLAGAGSTEMAEQMRDELARVFPGCAVKVVTDLEVALAAAGNGPAVVLVAGTGSAVIGRDATEHIEREGGQGPVIGDEGSAYDIGRKAVAVALRERRGADSSLGARILQSLGFASWEALRERAQAEPDQVFPRIFPIVAEAAEANDTTAQSLLRDAAKELAAQAKTLIERLGLENSKFTLAKTGGVIDGSVLFDETLDSYLREVAPHAIIGLLATPPAEVAARLALELLAPPRGAGACL